MMFLYGMAGLLGAAIGSFLGVVVGRTGQSKAEAGKIGKHSKFSSFIFQLSSSLGGRSRCTDCTHQLVWWENVPLLSFVVLGGQCSHCHSPIPWWLPLIELAGAAAGMLVAAHAATISLIGLIGLMLSAAALIWIFFSDLIDGVISDWAVVLGSIGAFFYQLPMTNYPLLLFPAIAAAAFFCFLVVATRGRGMGTGDITLAFFLGLFLGWPLVVVGIWFGFVLGALVGCLLIAIGRKRFGQTLPFGPFLIVGALVALQWGNQLLSGFF